MNYKEEIIAIEWRTAIGSVCFVAVEYGEYWQAYVGPAKTYPMEYGERAYRIYTDEVATVKAVSENGAKLFWQEAQAFFPQFDITRYKTFPRPYEQEYPPVKET